MHIKQSACQYTLEPKPAFNILPVTQFCSLNDPLGGGLALRNNVRLVCGECRLCGEVSDLEEGLGLWQCDVGQHVPPCLRWHARQSCGRGGRWEGQQQPVRKGARHRLQDPGQPGLGKARQQLHATIRKTLQHSQITSDPRAAHRSDHDYDQLLKTAEIDSKYCTTPGLTHPIGLTSCSCKATGAAVLVLN